MQVKVQDIDKDDEGNPELLSMWPSILFILIIFRRKKKIFPKVVMPRPDAAMANAIQEVKDDNR